MRTPSRLAVVTVLGIGSFAVAPSAQAASIVVNTTFDEFGSGPKCSLREAIRAANQDAAFGGCTAGDGTDTIKLKSADYQLGREGLDDDTSDGDLDVLSSIVIQGVHRNATSLDADWFSTGDRAFHVGNGSSLELKALTVKGGNALTPVNGGGILGGTDVTLKLTDASVVANKAASDGGGVYVDTGDVTIRRSIVHGNDALSNGGGVNVETGTLTVVDSTIRNNSVPGSNGGGIDVESDVVLNVTRSRVTGNYAESNGGGIYASSNSPVTIIDSTIAGNQAGGVGGGIRAVHDATLVRTTVSDNISGNDGGGFIGYANSTLMNSTFSNNRSDDDGGGVYLIPDTGDKADLGNLTITRNFADADDDNLGDGGGLYVESGEVNLANSIVAANFDLGDEEPDCHGASTSEGFNLIGFYTNCGTTESTDIVGETSPIFPGLGPLEMNGGRTETHELLKTSSALNAGDDSDPGSGYPACSQTDQRGAPRSDCDIGAYERVTCFGRVADVIGTAAKDRLKGTGAPEVFLSLGGNDVVDAGGGGDAVCGGGGDDSIKGGSGPDKLAGQEGEDTLNGGSGGDLCVGGASNDAASGCEKRRSI